MSFLLLSEQAADPGTPAADKGKIFIEANTRLPFVKNDQGVYVMLGDHHNASIAAQGPGFASDTWLTGSDLIFPFFGPQARSRFLWQLSASKSAASTAQPVYTIRTGANRSTADTSRLALTGPAQTAIADIGTLFIMATMRSIGAGSAAVLQGTAWWAHRGTAANTTTSGTGFANDSTGHVEATSAGFDSTVLAGQYISLSINGGASASWTVTQVWAQVWW